jgi:hypothetical protein
LFAQHAWPWFKWLVNPYNLRPSNSNLNWNMNLYVLQAALLGTRLLEALEVEVTHPITVNPFRRPFSESTSDNALPSYSNGFLFGINALWHDKAEGDNDHEREAETTKDDSHTEPLTGETK